MSEKRRFPASLALAVYAELEKALGGACERLCAAGSLRRGKADVGDLEILYIPRFELAEGVLFGFSEMRNAADEVLFRLLKEGVLAKRVGVAGGTAWGEKNKLAVHVPTGLPVDLFSTDAASWFNYLVCRTGPAESNAKIATRARGEGWKWEPYGAGFRDLCSGKLRAMKSEAEVFEFVGLPVPAWVRPDSTLPPCA